MEVIRDLRLALRSLRKAPSFAASVVITLAIAVGVTTAMLSMVDSVLLQPIAQRRDPRELTAGALPACSCRSRYQVSL